MATVNIKEKELPGCRKFLPFFSRVDKAEIDPRVQEWEKAKFDRNYYLCTVKTSGNKTLFAYLGPDSLSILTSVHFYAKEDRRRVGLVWMAETNMSNFTKTDDSYSAGDMYKELGLELYEVRDGIQCGGSERRGPEHVQWALDLCQGEEETGLRKVKDAKSASEFAGQIEQIFAWKITPLNAKQYLQSPSPIVQA